VDRCLAVLDDEEGICELVGRVASAKGYRVFATTRPSEFLQYVRANRVSVVVLDLRIPNTDGVEILRHLAASSVAANILIVSGVADRVLDTALRIGHERGLRMAGVLQKPFHVDQLREKLDDIRRAEDYEVSDELLKNAIFGNELILHYQAIQDLKTKQIRSVETLVRWNRPGYGLIMPADFVPLAERCGLIDPLTEWVTATAIQQLANWRRQGLELNVSINVSTASLHDYRFPDRLEAVCRAAGVNPEWISIELTETATMKDAIQLMDVLTRLRLKGFQLSLDDFGTGYSSLVQLKRLPFSAIKIDQSFIGAMLDSAEDAVIVDTILGMARNLNLHTIAEGIETAVVAGALAAKGCDYGQGYHIAHPVPAEEIPALL
jgi:EAL domain-containing protein (putative c-di-GMP-specific phosphodiesterase class I)